MFLIDDDEILSGNLLPSICATTKQAPAGAILQLPWLSIRDGIDSVMTTGTFGKADVSSGFVDHFSYHWEAQGPEQYDHHHRQPHGICTKPNGELRAPWRPSNLPRMALGGIMHLQFSSRRRLAAKHYWYQLTERLRWPDRKTAAEINEMYSNTVRESANAQVAPVPASWWQPYRDADLMRYLHVDAEPWQLQAAKEIVAANPGIEAGLNDFGLL